MDGYCPTLPDKIVRMTEAVAVARPSVVGESR